MTDASVSVAPPPVLLTSLTSAVVADGLGDLTLPRECRGSIGEWGGVFAQFVRLTGRWSVEIEAQGRAIDLPSTFVEGGPIDGAWRSRHRSPLGEIEQTIAVGQQPPGAVRRLRFREVPAGTPSLTVTTRFVPFLLPVLVEGIRPPEFRLRTTAEGLWVQHRGFALRLAASEMPTHLFRNGGSWIGGAYKGPVREIALQYSLPVGPDGGAEITWSMNGGLARDLETALSRGERRIPSIDDVAGERSRAWTEWVRSTPTLEFPDAPELTRAYERARAALFRLYAAPDEELTGLVAGYPWYCAFWSRDLAVMLPAVLWMGDLEWVARSLRSAFRFQGRGSVAILGGEPGEMPMQFGPGPIFFYGTSDTTLRFPPVVEQLRRHGGDLASVGPWSEAIDAVLAWGDRRADLRTGLLRHGGEAEAIASATARLSRIHYGIDSPDTTIWDSADRRDHAIDVQVLWWETLRAADRLSEDPAADRGRQAVRLAETIRRSYPWPEEGYLLDSLRNDQPIRALRPNALRAVSAGILDPVTARSVVDRAARDDLTTPWGVRTLSSLDPAFRPAEYHQGQVWPIATAWAADAAFSIGDPVRGVAYLRSIAERFEREGGWAAECYRGDRPEPYDACFLLGFSIAPFLAILFERLWGIRPDAPHRSVEVRPCFPPTWQRAHVAGVRIGEGRLDLAWTPGRLSARWNGSEPLTVDAGDESRELDPGSYAVWELAGAPQG